MKPARTLTKFLAQRRSLILIPRRPFFSRERRPSRLRWKSWRRRTPRGQRRLRPRILLGRRDFGWRLKREVGGLRGSIGFHVSKPDRGAQRTNTRAHDDVAVRQWLNRTHWLPEGISLNKSPIIESRKQRASSLRRWGFFVCNHTEIQYPPSIMASPPQPQRPRPPRRTHPLQYVGSGGTD